MTERDPRADPLIAEQVIGRLTPPRDPGALGFLDERWLEIWHLVPPTRLAPLLAGVPEPELRALPGARFLRSLVLGDAAALPEPDDLLGAAAPRTLQERMRAAAVLARTRLSGRPAAALALADRLDAGAPAPLAGVADDFSPYQALQLGITALLANEPIRALGFLERARSARAEGRFGFVARDAQFKLALLHQLHGDPERAAEHLSAGAALPRGASWTEEWIDQTAELAAALADQDAGRPAGLRDRPLAAYGELWPFALLVQVREGLLARDTEAVERALAVAEHAGLPGTDGDGVAASAIPLGHAQLHLSRGHVGRARRAMLRAPQELLDTQLVRARIAFIAGEHAQVAAEATQGMTREPGFFRHRVELAGLLAAIQLQQGEDAVARSLMLTALQARPAIPRTLYRFLPHELTSHARASWGDDARLAALIPADYSGPGHRPLTAPLGRAIDLSERERETLELLVAGYSRARIAERLFVSENTVKSHLRTLYRKIGARDRETAVLWAVTNTHAPSRGRD
ncbi:helix-turn-helix transcriptional regulator [Leucobacter allii]|uniref:Helix-turn-helix transcriptional regulator n=1 Tax=Leucobacter allii TaxID=2932247 RepID=A0ABY4FM19_9MICO|nr:helix-turn-helix transcriptional regulator [Leucobacter allii]UOQ57304.1 helix-turn-helix transcriptional regulator [Leucobacter allii]